MIYIYLYLQHLETDINNHAENVEQIKDLNTSFQNSNHFLKEEIEERALATVNKYVFFLF